MVAAGVTSLMAGNEDSVTNQRQNPTSRHESHIGTSQRSNKTQDQSSVNNIAKKSTKLPSSLDIISKYGPLLFVQNPSAT